LNSRLRAPGFWVPTSYLAEGIPFALVLSASGTLFKDLGHGDGEITLAIASIAIMWSVKPLYAGFLDMFGSKRSWVVWMEFVMAGLLALCALALSLEEPFWPIVALLWLIAAASATQDICVDGIYVTSLDERRQASWIGWQGAFWVTGRIFATAVVVAIASWLQKDGRMDARGAWAIALGAAGATMAILGLYHAMQLPAGSPPQRPASTSAALGTFLVQWLDFLRKPKLGGMLAFVFLYRTGEGFLLMETPLFMQGGIDHGGLGMCATSVLSAACPHHLSDKASIDGLVSTAVSLIAGILGGAYASRVGLKRKTLLVMAFCMNVPNLTLVYLSQVVGPDSPVSLTTIATLVTIEKAGYSFGCVAIMLYMMQQLAPGKHYMTHFAFSTALMNLVLVPTQAASGPMAEALGYRAFFILACVATIPSFVVAALAPFPNSVPARAAERLEERRLGEHQPGVA